MQWRRQWHPTPVPLPGKSHGWRNLVGYSPWGRKELDMTERLHFHFHTNNWAFLVAQMVKSPPAVQKRRQWHPTPVLLPGKPHGRRSLLAAVHGVTKSRTRLSDFTFTFMHWRRKWQPTPVFLPGESLGWGGLECCDSWGHKESDTTEQLN